MPRDATSMTRDAHFSPMPTNVSKHGISGFAERLASELGYTLGAPLEPIVARIGGEISYRKAPMVEGRPEAMEATGRNKFVIFLPLMTTPERDRFTVAHELGHLFLHYPPILKEHPGAKMLATRFVEDGDPIQRRAEWEANWFSSAFLMPPGSFRARFAAVRGNLDQLAISCGVSRDSAKYRAEYLGLK